MEEIVTKRLVLSDPILDLVPENNKITDNVITNLKLPNFQTITDSEIIHFIYLHCRKVLEIAKDKNASKEVARIINLENFEIPGTTMGNAHSVDIECLISPYKNSEDAFLVIHNHPSNNHFSRRDIKVFTDVINLTILIVVGNQGSIYILEKTRQLSTNELLSIRKTLLDWKNNVIDFVEVITQIRSFGLVYTEI